MTSLLGQVRDGQVGVTATCLTAWRDGEDSPEADVGAVALADGLYELTLIRKLLNRKQV
jgi:hypothetical protein